MSLSDHLEADEANSGSCIWIAGLKLYKISPGSNRLSGQPLLRQTLWFRTGCALDLSGVQRSWCPAYNAAHHATVADST